MVLTGKRKRVLKDVIKYYVETTGKPYEQFILDIQEGRNKQDSSKEYHEWLAGQCYNILNKYEITLSDCIQNKDVIRASIKEEESRNNGEFYTPEVWAKDGREYLKTMLGDLWGKAYIWDASCYSMDTEIFTRRGWVTYDELRDDDKVYSLNPVTKQGEWMAFNRRFTRDVEEGEDLIHFTGESSVDGESTTDLLVTKDHAMYGYLYDPNCESVNGEEIRKYTAEEIYNYLNQGYTFTIVNSALYSGWTVGNSRALKGLIERPECFVTGSLGYGEGDPSGVIEITTEDKHLLSHIEYRLTLLGYQVKREGNTLTGQPKVKTTLKAELQTYSGKVWDITLDKNHIFLVRRNGVASFCGNCGTGNLLKTIDYPSDKIFMSSLLPEDIEMVKSILPDVEAFQLNFLDEIDWDENNRFFSNNLPPRLREVLETNQPLVFYMNPPYKVMEATSTDVGAYMTSHGMARSGVDIFHQFIYRMIMLKRDYNLTNMYMGIFGPVTMFHSKMVEDLYNELKRDFIFNGGMCFPAGDFSNTSESVGWLIGYTTWRTKKEGEQDRNVILEAKVVDANDNINIIGERLIRNVDECLHEWVQPKDVIRYSELPMLTTFNKFTGSYGKSADNALGYMMSAKRVFDSSRRSAITSLPSGGSVPITQENFWRCIASFNARRSYILKANPFNNSQYYSKPDTSIEGYDQWLIDGLVLALFDQDSMTASYRNADTSLGVLNMTNNLFPVPKEIVAQVVTDETIIQDLNTYQPTNQMVLVLLQQYQDSFSVEAKELYEFGVELILKTLTGTQRKDKNYDLWTNAWDAGLAQLRRVEGLISKEDEDKYSYLLLRLKDKQLKGVYKFGFMMDAVVTDGEE